jgi:hypothetical protein
MSMMLMIRRGSSKIYNYREKERKTKERMD